MSISRTLSYAHVDDLNLDPENPRLGRHIIAQKYSQERLLKEMKGWTLEELADSYIENEGFWTHEALLVVKEGIYDKEKPELIVVEGNRRLATLKYLYKGITSDEWPSRKWHDYGKTLTRDDKLFTEVPYLLADTRKDVQAFLGFRHVSGVKPWDSDEKAGYIAKLIEEEGLSYEQVMRKIGSKTPTVRELYIAYRTLLQIENTVEEFEPRFADNRFAVLYMTLRTEGARQYLDINMFGEPNEVREPIPKEHLNNLKNFSLWLFGTDDVEPIIKDTRQVSKFGKVLENPTAIEYLQNASRPSLEIAYRRSGGDVAEIIEYLERAAENLESALSRAHLYRESADLKEAIRRITSDTSRLASIFPDIHAELCDGAE